MISIIICSRNTDISFKLSNNILKTIGVEYELIVIDNSKNKHSISSAYNEGVKKAKFPYLCFMHDDIFYHTYEWGKKVIAHFNETKIGIIGITGTHFLPKTPSGWYQPMITSGGCLQRVISSDDQSLVLAQNLSRFSDTKSICAVAVDGMWFCIPKELFFQIKFDEEIFMGFHCYDLDICLQIRRLEYSVKIIADVLLEHSSSGSFDIDWIDSTNKLFKKWKSELPQIAGVEVDDKEVGIRTDLVSEVLVWISSYAQSQKELLQVRQSKAYKLGKILLKYFRWIKL